MLGEHAWVNVESAKTPGFGFEVRPPVLPRCHEQIDDSWSHAERGGRLGGCVCGAHAGHRWLPWRDRHAQAAG